MPDQPLAYHITFGTHGTRLHGDPRGTVDRSHNRPGDPIIGQNKRWERIERAKLRFAPLFLSTEQRIYTERTIPDLCNEFTWKHHHAACDADHVYVLLTAEDDGKLVRRLLKRRLSQSLSERWPLQDGQLWWATGGSVKWIWDQRYYQNVCHYIDRQRATPHNIEQLPR